MTIQSGTITVVGFYTESVDGLVIETASAVYLNCLPTHRSRTTINCHFVMGRTPAIRLRVW